MEDSKDIAAVSLPFTAGVALAAALTAALATAPAAASGSAAGRAGAAGPAPGGAGAALLAGLLLLAIAALIIYLSRQPILRSRFTLHQLLSVILRRKYLSRQPTLRSRFTLHQLLSVILRRKDNYPLSTDGQPSLSTDYDLPPHAITLNGAGRMPYILLFFCLGVFCYLTGSLLPGDAAPGTVGRLAARALDGLRRIIGEVPFAHDSSHSLLTALLTGDRSGLTAEQTAAFRDSGASHILALSGLHIGIIYLIINKLLSTLGNSPLMRRIRSTAVIILSAFYTIATGAGPSIVRAFLFILLNEVCSMFPERRSTPVRTLLVALTLQLAFHPSSITSLGFQLSYLAMTGILVLHPRLVAWYPSASPPPAHSGAGSDAAASPPLKRSGVGSDTAGHNRADRYKENSGRTDRGRTGQGRADRGRADRDIIGRIQPMRAVWKSASLAISCQIFTAPLVWLRFHTFPRYFIITNLLALPLTTAVMAGGVAAVALQGLGGCPPLLASLTDRLIQTLLFILSVISSL